MIHLANAKEQYKATEPIVDNIDLSTLINITGNTLIIPIQNGVIPEAGVNGLQITDLLKYVREVYVSLNQAYKSPFNEATIVHIDKAIKSQEDRTADRIARRVEGKNKE